MKVAIDTNIIIEAFVAGKTTSLKFVLMLVPEENSEPRLFLCHDHNNVISHEYEKNAGAQIAFRHWYKSLKDRKVFYFCNGRLPKDHLSRLIVSGCRKPSDHVFIGVAFRSNGILVSEDSDVGKGPNGHLPPHCDALQYLINEMGMRVYDVQEARQHLLELQSFQFIKDLGFVFEVQVRDYLQRLGYVAEQHKTLDGLEGDIDVYAERNNEILVCECEIHENPKAPIRAYKVTQIIKRLEFLCQRKPKRKITAWIASTSNWLEDSVNLWQKIESYHGSIQVMHFPLRPNALRRIQEQNLVGLSREQCFLDHEVRSLKRL
ncbi:hypothetical protein L0337_18805 [candidate division KSB1 bacterium]|nr:hypothetical protein [candidate division KSB1 bacterium]